VKVRAPTTSVTRRPSGHDPSWLAATGQWTENGRITLDADGVREFGDTNT
jgi:hypothetical protein